jgi:hypothetical protein
VFVDHTCDVIPARRKMNWACIWAPKDNGHHNQCQCKITLCFISTSIMRDGLVELQHEVSKEITGESSVLIYYLNAEFIFLAEAYHSRYLWNSDHHL